MNQIELCPVYAWTNSYQLGIEQADAEAAAVDAMADWLAEKIRKGNWAETCWRAPYCTVGEVVVDYFNAPESDGGPDELISEAVATGKTRAAIAREIANAYFD